MKDSDADRDCGGGAGTPETGGYGGKRLAAVAAALGFLLVYLLTNEVLGGVAVAAVLFALVDEHLSGDN